MLLPKTKEGFDSSNNQLALNFSSNASSVSREKIADRVHAIESSNITFHSGEIGKNNFTLKISYMGRSYSLRGIYKKEEIRSFYQEDYSNTIIRITEFSILAFRDDHYVSAFLPPKEYNKIMENAREILSSSSQGSTIH